MAILEPLEGVKIEKASLHIGRYFPGLWRGGQEENMGGIKQIAIETFISAAQRFGKTKEETAGR